MIKLINKKGEKIEVKKDFHYREDYFNYGLSKNFKAELLQDGEGKIWTFIMNGKMVSRSHQIDETIYNLSK